MSNVHVCLQVRTSSKRMPFKCFLPIRKIESIKVLIRRIKSKKYSVNILSSNDPSDDYLITTLHELARIIAQINYDDQRGIKPLAIQLFMQAVLAAADPNGNTLENPFTYIDIETFLGEAKEDLSK